MISCRDPDKIGFVQYQCPNHPEHTVKVPHSCKCRFCNTCGKVQTDNWISDCNQILPNVEYRHLTLTIPQELRKIIWEVRPLKNCLFKAANECLQSFFTEKKIKVALTMVIHTFGRRLNWNPHLHIILSCGGLTDKLTWKEQEFIPYKMLQKRWGVKLLNCLKDKIKELLTTDEYREKLKPFSDSKFLYKFFEDLYRINWYVHLSEEKVDMDHTVGYIGRYSRRPVISEAKILDYNKEKETITIEYQDHRDLTPTRWTLSVYKFIELLTQHIPEKYFHQIRHFGLVANRITNKYKTILEKLFGKAKRMLEKFLWRQRQKLLKGKDPLICPYCKSELEFMFRKVFSRRRGCFVTIF